MTDLALAEAWGSLGGGFEVEDGLLDVGGEIGEVEDLSDSGAGDAGGAGDFGLVFDLAGGKEVVEADREGHQFGDVRQLRRGRPPGRLGRFDPLSAAGSGRRLKFDLDVIHCCPSWLE